jgi:IS1 family transposase
VILQHVSNNTCSFIVLRATLTSDRWEVLQAIENRITNKFHYNCAEEIFNDLAKEVSRFRGATYERLKEKPLQWPIFEDGNDIYSNVYGKKATQQKSKFTNIVENLNSQMRDKISYLVRRTKAHSKSFDWLNQRLAMFFVELNLKGYKN